MKWMDEFPGCNWGLPLAPNGLLALDLDVKHEGPEKWAKIAGPRDFTTRTQVSGSGGRHYVYQVPEDSVFKGRLDLGVDIKHRGYILVAPSMNAQGMPYYWINPGVPFAPLPGWMSDLLKRPVVEKYERVSDVEHDTKLLHDLAERLTAKSFGYEEWIKLGMSLHAALPGEDGLEIFLKLTRSKSYKMGDEELARSKWAGFRKNDSSVGLGTFFHVLDQLGVSIHGASIAEDRKLFEAAIVEELEEESQREHGFYERNGHFVCWDDDEIVEHFNKHYAYISSSPETPFLCLAEKDSDVGGFLSARALDIKTAAYKKIQVHPTKSGHTKTTPAWKVWLDHLDRHGLTGLMFAENDRPDMLNLWRGLKLEPLPDGDPTPILDMIHLSLCGGDRRKSEWLMDWLAHIVQKPFERVSVVPVLISKQGAGKGLLFDYVMKTILAPYFTTVTSSEQLTARFNSNLKSKLLTFVDEATWRGNKTEDGILKRMIGSPTLSIEEKFGGRYDVENFSRYAIASNNAEAVAVEQGNRRYVIIEASETLANDLRFFGPIAEKIKQGDVTRAFYSFLLARDIKAFNGSQILEGNTAGVTAKISSAGTVAQFWYDLFTSGEHKIWTADGVNSKLVYDTFLEFHRRISSYEKNMTTRIFWVKSAQLMPSLTHRARVKGKYWREISPEAAWLEFAHSLSIPTEGHADFDMLMTEDLEAVE